VNKKKLLTILKKELETKIDPVYKKGARKYIKGELKNFGVRTPYVRKISLKYFRDIKVLPIT